jgi:hypothetical protein
MAKISTETPNPWKKFLSTVGMGIFSIAGGIYLYYDFANWEQTGGTRMMNSIIYGIYRVLGKGGVLAFCLLAGVTLLITGTIELRKHLKK